MLNPEQTPLVVEAPFVVLVPARMRATRLPGKPLLDLGGQPMVVRVMAQVAQSAAQRSWVATEDAAIAEVVQAHGYEVVLTGAQHESGTSRLAEAVQRLQLPPDTIVVNVQGDEPQIDPALIRLCALTLAQSTAPMATVVHPLQALGEVLNPNVVKVVLDAQQHALYFSRAPIPWPRDAWAQGTQTWPDHVPFYRHVGVYAYRAHFLQTYAALAPSPLEQVEALEQLRVLWHGHRIACAVWHGPVAAGVDTMEDWQRVAASYAVPA